MASITKTRIESIDFLKGLVMVIMALDHTRDFFHYCSMMFNIEDPNLSTVPIFFTRWITHFCAPAFSFLAGVSAYMVGKRKSRGELSGFLVKRGLWLVFIEVTIVNFGWIFLSPLSGIGLQVIWALGVSMIVLAALIYLPRNLLLVFCCVLIFGHNLLDGVHFNHNFFWSMLHEPGFFPVFKGLEVGIWYPLVPWIAVMALGYYFGAFYEGSYDALKRRRLFNIIGFVSIGAFVALRWSNVYGDPHLWQHYNAFSKELISFMNPAKYPPSLLYLLMTLGLTFVFLANVEQVKGRVVDFFSVFGRVPFFYYILHIYVIHVLAIVFSVPGFIWHVIDAPYWAMKLPKYGVYGYTLGIVYLVWIGVIVLLYPVCRWFDGYKQGHRDKWWLSYL